MSLTSLVFVVCFFAGLALALFRHPLLGLYTYVAVFYLDPPSRWWATDLPDLRWSLVAAAVTLVATFRLPAAPARPSWLATTPGKVLVLFTAWVWLQSLWALDPYFHRDLSIIYTKYVVLYYVIYRLIDTPEKIAGFVISHVAGCFYLGWLAYHATFAGRLEDVGGPGLTDANALGMQMATAVVMGAMLILHYSDWRRWLAIAAMPFMLNAMVLTSSRSAFLGLVAGAVVLVYLRPMVHRRLFLTFAALGLTLGGALAHETFWERMGTIKSAAKDIEHVDTSAQIRVLLAQAQLKMVVSYPFGTGHRGTAVLSPDYLPTSALTGPGGPDGALARSSHNSFLTVLVEHGIPGIIIFSAFVFWFFRRALDFRRLASQVDAATLCTMAAGITAAFTVVHVAGMFVDYLKAEVQIWCLALAASAAVLAKASAADRNVAPEPRSGGLAPGRGPNSRVRIR